MMLPEAHGRRESEEPRLDAAYFQALLAPLSRRFDGLQFPLSLFHYTDSAGLLGIVDGKALWATHILFLNDEGELRHAAALVSELYASELERQPPSSEDPANWLVRDFLHRVRYLNETRWAVDNIYVACFCETDDLLSQWRGYGDHGGGFSLGFRPELLLQTARAAMPESEISLGSVVYDQNEQSARLKNIYESVRASLIQNASDKSPSQLDQVAAVHARAFMREAFRYAPFFKQKTFGEEREWRIVIEGRVPRDRLRFRRHSLGIVPYLEFPTSNDVVSSSLASIRVGPRKDQPLALRSLEMLLDGRGVRVSSSEVTLR